MPVNGDRHAAKELQFEARGGHDEIGLEFPARAEAEAVLREALDRLGDDVGAPVADGREEIPIGGKA